MGLLSFRRRARAGRGAVGSRSLVSALALLALHSAVAPSVASAQAPDAKTSLASGTKAAGAKDWSRAATEFEASNKAAPSADALEGLANAHYQQKNDAEAYAAYDAWLKTYGAKAPAAKKKAAEQRLGELAGRTGQLALEVNEAGASISVDDKPMGTPRRSVSRQDPTTCASRRRASRPSIRRPTSRPAPRSRCR
jgi:hypothetical protein